MFLLNGERFEQLKEYNEYAISDNGTVLTNKNKHKQWRPLAQGHGTTSNYMQVSICHCNQRKHLQVHRLVAEYFVVGWFDGAVVGHKDANIDNNHYSNLCWITQKENIHQSYRDSGVDAMRNYCQYIIYYQGKRISPVLNGGTEVKQYIESYNLPTSYTSLMRHHHSKNYTLARYSKLELID